MESVENASEPHKTMVDRPRCSLRRRAACIRFRGDLEDRPP